MLFEKFFPYAIAHTALYAGSLEVRRVEPKDLPLGHSESCSHGQNRAMLQAALRLCCDLMLSPLPCVLCWTKLQCDTSLYSRKAKMSGFSWPRDWSKTPHWDRSEIWFREEGCSLKRFLCLPPTMAFLPPLSFLLPPPFPTLPPSFLMNFPPGVEGKRLSLSFPLRLHPVCLYCFCLLPPTSRPWHLLILISLVPEDIIMDSVSFWPSCCCHLLFYFTFISLDLCPPTVPTPHSW